MKTFSRIYVQCLCLCIRKLLYFNCIRNEIQNPATPAHHVPRMCVECWQVAFAKKKKTQYLSIFSADSNVPTVKLRYTWLHYYTLAFREKGWILVQSAKKSFLFKFEFHCEFRWYIKKFNLHLCFIASYLFVSILFGLPNAAIDLIKSIRYIWYLFVYKSRNKKSSCRKLLPSAHF